MTILVGLTAVCGSVAAQETAVPEPKTSTPESKATATDSGWSAQIAPDGSTGITLDAAQIEMVKKISQYFSDMTTLHGRFVQTGADKKVMKGKFKMKRPGKFRFDYARPSLQVVISDGEYLAIQDYDLGNEDRISLDQTPFRVLLRADVDLVRDARIIEVQETGDSILLALKDKNPDAPGLIKLTFTKNPKLELAGWITSDAQGLDTHVAVKQLEHGKKIDEKDFKITAPPRRFLQ